jgi:hypothetical protein
MHLTLVKKNLYTAIRINTEKQARISNTDNSNDGN